MTDVQKEKYFYSRRRYVMLHWEHTPSSKNKVFHGKNHRIKRWEYPRESKTQSIPIHTRDLDHSFLPINFFPSCCLPDDEKKRAKYKPITDDGIILLEE